MKRSLLMLALGGALGALALANLADTMEGAPAFDPDARIEGVYGDWHVGDSSAMHDRSDYLYQLANGFLYRGALDQTPGKGGETGPETAVRLLRESVSLAPANAHVWAALAWAHAMTADFEMAREAMRNSWRLAPYNLALAGPRLDFASFLAADDLAFSEQEARGIRKDAETLSRFSRRSLEAVRESSPPPLAALIGAG